MGVALLIISSCEIFDFGNDPIVARVKFKYLHQSDIDRALGTDFTIQQEQDYIEQWVIKQLWVIDARRHSSLNKTSKRQINDYRNSLLIRQYKEDYIQKNISVSENDVIEYYEKNENEFKAKDYAAFVEIYTCSDKDMANNIILSLKKNQGPPMPATLKLVYKGDCIDALDAGIFSSKPTNIVGPVADRGEYYIVSVIERYSPNSLFRLEHVRQHIIQKLQMTEYINAVQTKEKELKETINVKIFKSTNN